MSSSNAEIIAISRSAISNACKTLERAEIIRDILSVSFGCGTAKKIAIDAQQYIIHSYLKEAEDAQRAGFHGSEKVIKLILLLKEGVKVDPEKIKGMLILDHVRTEDETILWSELITLSRVNKILVSSRLARRNSMCVDSI